MPVKTWTVAHPATTDTLLQVSLSFRMKALSISLIATAGILCGCAATTPKNQTRAQAEVTPSQEPTLFLPSSLTLSLFDPVGITPTVTNSFHWTWTTPLMIEVHAPSPSETTDPFPFQYPQTSYRPEYLIDTR
jgi:hypothetical protein